MNLSHKNLYAAYFIISALLWTGYFYFTFTSPIDPENRLGLTDLSTVRLVQVSIALPIMIIWGFGAYAVNGLSKYLGLIKGTPEAAGLAKIALGIALILFGLAFNSFVGSIRAHYNPSNYNDLLGLIDADTTQLDIRIGFIKLMHYLGVLWVLLPYSLMFWGSWLLLKTSGLVKDLANRLFFPAFALVLASMMYLMLFFQNPIRQVPLYPEEGQLATYYMPDPVILSTIVLPYIIAWGLGLLAALATDVYSDKVRGLVYKEALKKLSVGFLTVVGTSILLQIIGTLGNAFINWSLTAILLLVYVLVAIIGVGYVVFALGVKQLRKIETV